MTGSTKRPLSPTETVSEKKKKTDSQTCNKCGELVSGTLHYHQRNSCSERQLRCRYPSGEVVICQPSNGVFTCAKCPKAYKKAITMQGHARECAGCENLNSNTAASNSPAPSPAPAPSLVNDMDDDMPNFEDKAEREDAAPAPALSSSLLIDMDGELPASEVPLLTSSLNDTAPNAAEPQGEEQHDTFGTDVTSGGSAQVDVTGHLQDVCTSKPTPSVDCIISPATTNKTTVTPDHNCVIPDFLRCTPYVVNTKFYVLICLECQYAVAPQSSASHLRSHHRQCPPPPDFQNQLQQRYPGLKAEPIHPGKDVRPVFGLRILEDYLVCTGCLHGYRNKPSLQNHRCNAGHDGRRISFTSHVQTFFAGLHLCYFPVITSDENDAATDASSDYSLYKRQRRTEASSSPEDSLPEDHRQLLQFLPKEGWLSHVGGFPPEELVALIQDPEPDGPLKHLEHRIYEVMEKVQDSISAAGYLLQRSIGKRPSNLRNGITHVLHSSVETPTLRKYSKISTRLITFVFRCYQGWPSKYQLTLTAAQLEQCSMLQDHLKSGPAAFSTTKVGEADGADPMEGAFMDDEDEEDSIDVEEASAQGEIPAAALASLDEYSMTDRRLLEFLSHVFTHLPATNDNKFYSPIIRFLILESYQRNGDWLPSRRITEVISALTFCGRQVMFYAILKFIAEQGSRHVAALHSILPYLDEELEGPLTTLYLLKQPPQVLLVAAEQCTGEAIKCYLRTLHHLSRLARTVVDEAHLLKKHERFRPCLNLLEFLGGIPVPIIIMTATWPRSLEKVLFLKIGPSSFRVLRQSTHRPEIRQQLVLIEDAKDNQALNASVTSKIQALIPDIDEKDRMLLFCLSHDDCDAMAQSLGWMPYHSHISLEQRAQSMQMWKKGQIRGLACTSMLNCGLDYPHVRYVYHLNLPRDAVDYEQAIGRCARDGNMGTAITYYRPRSQPPQPDGDDLFGRFVIVQMAKEPNTCRNVLLGQFLDAHGLPCFSLANSALCDSCERMTAVSGSRTQGEAPSNPRLDTLFAAAYSQIQGAAQLTTEEEFGRQVRNACDVLYKCCVYCWLLGKECVMHTFNDCPRASEFSTAYKDWADDLIFPNACCFYCGGPQRLRFRDSTGQRLHVHEHESDKTCHWQGVFKPLGFFLFRQGDERFRAHILQLSRRGGMEIVAVQK